MQIIMNNTAWTVSPVQSLDYSKNCTSFGRFILEITRDGETALGRFWNDTDNGPPLSWADVRTNTVLDMLRGALPTDYSDNLPAPPPERLMLWFLENSDNITSVENLVYHASVCRGVICQAIGFRGAGEVIGVGVLSSSLDSRLHMEEGSPRRQAIPTRNRPGSSYLSLLGYDNRLQADRSRVRLDNGDHHEFHHRRETLRFNS